MSASTPTATTAGERYELARRIIDEIAASGRCADFIDVHESAKRRGGFDLEVDRLLAQKSIRDEVDAICDKARGNQPSRLERDLASYPASFAPVPREPSPIPDPL